MRLIEIMTGDDDRKYFEIPDDAVPYKSKNAPGVLPLSPYLNDMDAPDVFNDVHIILSKIDQLENEGKYTVAEVPINKILATQYWFDPWGMGSGDSVFDELDDYPVVALLSDGFYHIIDGHHRTTKAAKAGKSSIKAYLFKL